MSKVKVSQFKDTLHGTITLKQAKSYLMMTNAEPDHQGSWIKEGNEYKWVRTPNRASRRHPNKLGLAVHE